MLGTLLSYQVGYCHRFLVFCRFPLCGSVRQRIATKLANNRETPINKGLFFGFFKEKNSLTFFQLFTRVYIIILRHVVKPMENMLMRTSPA